MRNFETRFEAQLTRFNAHKSMLIPDALIALMLLGNSNVDNNQRVSILVAVVSNVTETEDTDPNVENMLSAVKYSNVASVLRQCERKRQNTNDCGGGSLNANSSYGPGRGRFNDNGCGKFRSRFKQTKTPE